MQHHGNKHGRIMKKYKIRIAHGAAQNGFCIKKKKKETKQTNKKTTLRF